MTLFINDGKLIAVGSIPVNAAKLQVAR